MIDTCLRLILLVGLFIASVAANPGSVDATDTSLQETFEICQSSSGKQRIDACSLFIELEREDTGKLSSAYYYRAEAFSALKDHDKAIAYFLLSNEYFSDPNNDYKLGNEYLSLKRYSEAIEQYSYVIEKLPRQYAAGRGRN